MQKTNETIAGEQVVTASGTLDAQTGSVGLKTQLSGSASTVSNLSSAGGMGDDGFVQPDIDQELFRFNSDDTPLLNFALSNMCKQVMVSSPEVDHYMIDEARSMIKTTAKLTAGGGMQGVLPLAASEQRIPRVMTTLLVNGVDGYLPDGKTKTPGRDLMLIVTGRDATSGNPIVRAMNGPKANTTDEYSQMVDIAQGTKIIVLANALGETQKEVEPTTVMPQAERVYLQKSAMNQVVSDYLKSQKTRIPFQDAIQAEATIAQYKREVNRTLWIGRKGKVKIDTEKVGVQDLYTTEGLRWQFKRELQHSGKWTVEKVIAMAKMVYTGEDMPKSVILLAGKNLLENIQCIDYSKHPEVQIVQKENSIGWSVTNIHTVFGDIQIKHEPTLDRLGLSNSGGLIGENRLVHYSRTPEHTFEENVEGHEAKRSGVIRWEAVALKGTCHIWIDGEGVGTTTSTAYLIWDSASAPSGGELVDKRVYYLLQDCPAIHKDAKAGQLWQATVAVGGQMSWVEYATDIVAKPA